MNVEISRLVRSGESRHDRVTSTRTRDANSANNATCAHSEISWVNLLYRLDRMLYPTILCQRSIDVLSNIASSGYSRDCWG